MQLQWFPQSICSQVDRSVRNFPWQGNNDSGMHMVGWDKITQPKRCGGLGIRVTRHNNTALLGKLIWDATNAPEKLWVKLMKDKYFPHRSFLGASASRGSSIWNSMMKARQCLGPAFTFKFGNGDTSVWNAGWLLHTPLGPQLPSVHIYDINLKLKDLYVAGTWNLDILHTVLPPEWRDAITSLRPTLAPNVADSWTWAGDSTGVYTVKSGYNYITAGSTNVLDNYSWKWIWQLHVPANVQFFIWQFAQQSLPTKANLLRRHVLTDATCAICQSNEETALHCLFTCTYAVEVWKLCNPSGFIAPVAATNLASWLQDLIRRTDAFPAIILWRIWCARNAYIFENKPISSAAVSAQAFGLWKDSISAFGEGTNTVRQSSGLAVSWQPPSPGWVALNVDGSAQLNPPTASFGGLIRDSDGRFVHGFYGSLGNSTIMHAELHALLHGLELCWDLGFRQVVCYSDSLNTLRLIEEAEVLFHVHGNEVALVRSLIGRAWEVTFQHVYREANHCADLLAKLGMSASLVPVHLDSPPVALYHLLQADAQGFSFVRP